MSRPDFVRPSGQWPNESVPGASDYQRLDANQAKLVNGDAGGSWAPSSPIIVGGGGLTATPFLANGGVATATGGRVIIDHAAGDFPQLASTRSRTITVPMLALANVDTTGTCSYTTVTDDAHGWGISTLNGGGAVRLYLEVPGRYMHIGARIAGAAVSFYVRTRPPQNLPTNALLAQYYWSGDAGTALKSPATIYPATQWNAGHAVSIGSTIYPSSQTTNSGYYFVVTNAGSGTIGSTEPAWPTTVGASTPADSNGVVFTNAGANGWYPFFGASIDTYWNKGAGQVLSSTFYGSSGNTVDAATRFQLALVYVDPATVFTSLQLTFDTISSMAPE